MPIIKSKKLTLNGMKRALRKPQHILCASPSVHTLWLSLALDMLIHGDTVEAVIFSPFPEMLRHPLAERSWEKEKKKVVSSK